MWVILIRLIKKEIKSLVLLILTSNTSATYQHEQQQQQQQHNQFFSSSAAVDIDDGYSEEEREWIRGRDVECLLFMLTSLMDCVCEPSTPPSSLPLSTAEEAVKLLGWLTRSRILILVSK